MKICVRYSWNVTNVSNLDTIKWHCPVHMNWANHYALVNQIPHYPSPGPMRGLDMYDKGIDERHLP